MSDESNSTDVTIQECSINNKSSKPSTTAKKPQLNIEQESAKKFTAGQPIIDKKNPFKINNNHHSAKKHKEINTSSLNSLQRSPSDDVITTDDVLRQSKYVKTYIKNPDPYFTYDPEILAKLRSEEQSGQRKAGQKPNGALKELTERIKCVGGAKDASNGSSLSYKKCSKPNYPDLADIKVKVGTDFDGTLLNPAEVQTNVKKFDERVKKIKFNFDEYSEDMELRNSSNSSVEEISTSNRNDANNQRNYNKELLMSNNSSMRESEIKENQLQTGENSNSNSFSNTIRSKEFQKYLKFNGLVLVPQQTRSGPTKTALSNGTHSRANNILAPKRAETANSFNRSLHVSPAETPKKIKRASLFQRLLTNSLFSGRRKTIPKETVPKAQSVYDSDNFLHSQQGEEKEQHRQRAQSKRVVLERKRQQDESREFNYISNACGDAGNLKSGDQVDGVRLADDRLVKVENALVQPKQNRSHSQGIPTSVYTEATHSYLQNFGRTSSMDRHELLRRSKGSGAGRILAAGSVTTSTPTRPLSSTDSELVQCASLSTLTSSLFDGEDVPTAAHIDKNDLLHRLREKQKLQNASKDGDSYTNAFNRKLKNDETNFYERLQRAEEQAADRLQPIYSALNQSCQFVRGDPQRSTFSSFGARTPSEQNYNVNNIGRHEQVNSLDNFQLSQQNTLERLSPHLSERSNPSREEIMEKVRQFCRNSMRRKTEQTPSLNTIHCVAQSSPQVSPASYASVATERRYTQQQLPRKSLSELKSVLPGESFKAAVYANVHSSGNQRVAHKPQKLPSVDSQAARAAFDIVDNANKNNLVRSRNTVKYPATMATSLRQRTPNDGRCTPLILERSYNLQSQIYRPPQGGTSAQYNARNHLVRHSNLRHGQYFSDSVNFLPPEQNYNQKTDIRLSQQQLPLRIDDKERNFPEINENERLNQLNINEEDWQNENKSGRQQTNDQVNDERRRSSRREDPRRHTLGGDMLQYGVMQGQPQQRAMDLENQSVRSYAPVNQGPLFDEDPGIMSEVETASTGFRRGGKQRSSLPVVRTPSKTLERPLGLVFLQYRSETKRALLPNEITSIDTVRALFVRSFPRQLTMAYLEGPNVKIYIHDASKDMFYELEDVRSHLREIRDRSVLRLFESNEVAAAPPQVLPGGPGIPQPLPQAVPMQWDQDQSYFSEPEFDSEYQHQHIHKSKSGKQPPYYVGASQTLPRGMYSDRNKVAIGAPAKPLRSYGSRGNMGPIFPYPPDQLYSIPDGYTSSPERGTRGSYEEPYYSQYGTRGIVAPVIDEEASEVAIAEDQYALYGMKLGPAGRIPRTANQMYDPTRPEDLHRIRVEHMERQLANLTGLVQKALVNQNPQIGPPAAVPLMNANYLGVPTQCRANGTGDEVYVREKAPKLGKSSCHKSVSFEKSVSFSDDIQGMPKSHSPQHPADSKPTKPAIKSSTLPRTSSQERDRLKPPPPPKPIALTQSHNSYRADIALAPEVYNQLRGLQKKAKDLRMEVRTLRRLSQAQAVAVREDIKDAFMRIRATLLASSGNYWDQQGDQEKTRISREEELYKQEIVRLEKDLGDLESAVEGLRGEVINRRTRVNMAAVEDMALVLSRASKTVAELKLRFPGLSNGMRNLISSEMEKVVREEKFLKEEPDRLESALRRCKKLTGTLVTLKRLASVQEQRLPPNEPPNSTTEEPPCAAEIPVANKQPVPTPRMGPIAVSGGVPPENALDALLDELQTFAKPLNQHNDLRPDDSTSDDSSQMILSTVTTQIPQGACLYNPTESIAGHELQEPSKTIVSGPNSKVNNANMLQINANLGSLRRLHSYPSGSDTDTSPPQPIRLPGKPPVPERNAELLSKVNKRIPPPPPPRTSSRSPLASPTSPNVPHRMPSLSETEPLIGNGAAVGATTQDGSGNSSGNESGNDQMQRQVALERRHQELLRKQKMLQEQYLRLQQMSKMPAVSAMPPLPADILQLKKTGSESNLPKKMDLSIANSTGSMKNLNSEAITCSAGSVSEKNEKNIQLAKQQQQQQQQLIDMPKAATQMQTALADRSSSAGPETTITNSITTTIKQVYETEIL